MSETLEELGDERTVEASGSHPDVSRSGTDSVREVPKSFIARYRAIRGDGESPSDASSRLAVITYRGDWRDLGGATHEAREMGRAERLVALANLLRHVDAQSRLYAEVRDGNGAGAPIVRCASRDEELLAVDIDGHTSSREQFEKLADLRIERETEAQRGHR
jgi:hypothetical protein